MGKVDQVSEKYNVVSLSRIFPDAGIFEEAHKAYGLHLWYEIKLMRDVKLSNVIEDYRGTNYFDRVEERRPYSAIREVDLKNTSSSPSGTNDPFFSSQWHFENTSQTGGTSGADINLIKAWQMETGSPSVIVAVIDGGINVNHPDLKEAMWVNEDEIPGNGIDDDNNGYVDDIHGYGFGDQSHVIYPDDHGTHVAGIIGAMTNNGIGGSGIAGGNGSKSGVKLMSCAGFGNFNIGGFEEAMVYAADNGAVISQNSWGGGSGAIQAAINYFINRAGYDNSSANFSKNIQTGPMAGGVVIFAAGNSNTSDPYYGYPASYEKVIAVAATDHNDEKSHFSNYGSWVDISAPGSNIFSTKAYGYGSLSGTSMACPHVSGVAALIVSNLQHKGLQPSDIWNRLRFSSKSLNAKNPNYTDQLGWGRLDAFLALKEPDLIPPGAITDLQVEKSRSLSMILKWTSSGENYNEGQAAEYDIRYSINPINESNFNSATKVLGPPTPPLSGEQISFEIKDLTPNTTYYFALKSIDVFSNISSLSNVVSARTLKAPSPELVTPQLAEELFTGAIAKRHVLVKNIGEEDDLLVRLGAPVIQPAPVVPPLGAKGKLFAINSSQNTVEQLNTKTGKVIHSIPLPVPSSKTVEGLAFDGHFLFYGRSRQVYKIDVQTGEVIRVINLDDLSIINGLAWSGQYLYVSGNEGSKGRVYEVNVDNGSVLRKMEYSSELAFFGINNSIVQIRNGQLIETNINGEFIRVIPTQNIKCVAFSSIDNFIFVSRSTGNSIDALRPSDGAVMFTIPYPITTALAGDEHKLGWIETREQVISIAPGQTGEIPLTFISAGLTAGTWTGSVSIVPINSNSAPFPVSLSMNVLEGPDIETVNEIDFGFKYLGLPIDTTIIVENRGTSDLIISQIQSNNTEVTSSMYYTTLTPGQRIDLKINITPIEVGSVDALITFLSNDPDESELIIPVRASILEAPEIDITPDAINATLSAGESATFQINITNSGGSVFHWNANLVGTASNTNNLQSVSIQNGDTLDHPNDSTSFKTDLGEISLKAPSPEPLTCLVYDPIGELIYAKSLYNNTFYTYNPALDFWSSSSLTPHNFTGQGTHLNGKLYFGGSQLNIFTIQSDSWTSVEFPVSGSAISITNDDKYVYIGIDKTLYRFDPVTEGWLELAPPPNPLYMSGFGALSYHSGIIYANGIQPIMGDGNTLFFKYFTDSNTWVKSSSISGKISTGGAIDLSSARYFVVGAPYSLPTQRNKIAILDIRMGEWSQLASPFSFGSLSGLTFVGKEGKSGIYFIQGSDGTKFGRYETPSAPSWFSISPFKGSLYEGETQTISINLNTQALFGGTYNGNVRVYSKNPDIEKNIPLKLNVLGTPDISINKFSVDVGNVVLGYNRGASVTVRNKGSSELAISNIEISNPEFSISKTATTIPIGEAVSFTTYFSPTFAGKQTCTFTFHHNDPNKSELQFELTGTGVYPAQLLVPTDTINLTLFTGETAIRKFTVHNIGNGSTEYLVAWGVEQWIKIDSAGYAVNIGPQQAREFEVTIDAKGLPQGQHKGTIRLLDHLDPSRSEYSIPILLNVIAAPDFTSNTTNLNYGEQFVHGTYDSIISIKNEGVLPLLISSIESDNPIFTITVASPLALNPGEAINATISFQPSSIGTHNGMISFTSNDPIETVATIYVSGTSVDPPVLVSSDSELFVSVFAEDSKSEVINLVNNGGSALRFRIVNESNQNQYGAGDFTSRANTPIVSGAPSKFTGLTSDPSSGLLYAQYLWYQNLYTYNPQSNTWTQTGNTPNVGMSKNVGATILDSKMYCTYLEHPSIIYIYDMTLKYWTTKSNEFNFESANLTTDGNLVYLAGGGKFASFNPKTFEWKELSIPNFNLDGLGGLSYFEGEIYAHSASSTGFAKYTVATGIWQKLLPLPDLATLGSSIDPIRRRYYAYWKNYLYEYDINSGIWTVLYSPIFEAGDTGGLSFSSIPGYEGVYFLQGNSGNGFARYEPRNELAWLRTSQLIGEIEPMNSQDIGINCHAINLSPGLYNGKVIVISNDPEQANFYIPITLEVKNPDPTIDVVSLISDTVDRVNPTRKFLLIKNKGREILNWNLANTLPPWLSVDKALGSVSGFSTDSVEIVFTPVLLPFWTAADHTFEINSNDQANTKILVRLVLAIENNSPIITKDIPSQILNSDNLQIDLKEHFTDPDNDPLNFSASLSTNLVVSATVIDSKLMVSPIKGGIATIQVTAIDIYNSSAIATFNVDNLFTEIEPQKGDLNFLAIPNPFKTRFTINFDGFESEKALIVLVDINGRIVLRSIELNLKFKNELQIDAGHLPAGLYACMLFVNDKLTRSVRLLKIE